MNCALIAVIKEQRIPTLDANGQMTDAALKRIAELDPVTRLELGSSQRLTDDGLRNLAHMPQLRHLDLSNYPGSRITDRGLEILGRMPSLERIEFYECKGLTDAERQRDSGRGETFPTGGRVQGLIAPK